jgi:uncharacterized protein YjbI with pentapeptide repeats
MANIAHLRQLNKGAASWNAWRKKKPDIRPDLSEAPLLRRRDLYGANLREADLRSADLSGAYVVGADLGGADLSSADLSNADVSHSNLGHANLNHANLMYANLTAAKLGNANLSGAILVEADLTAADLSSAILVDALLSAAELTHAKLGRANLSGALLREADLRGANLSSANLSGANLYAATLVETDLTGADLTGCRIYGVSAWGLKLEGATQQDLIITREDEPEITVDDIEVAQFVYLMLDNQKIRNFIDIITSKAVLILGRFTDERKAVLNALRDELRKRDYLPILFDFELPKRRNVTETVTLLARMARFVIADLTDPSSIPQELQAIIPSVRVPVQPLLLEGSSLYSMFKDFDPQDFHWVLPVYRYKKPEQLLATLAENVIAPAEAKVKVLEERRRMIEAELTKASP